MGIDTAEIDQLVARIVSFNKSSIGKSPIVGLASRNGNIVGCDHAFESHFGLKGFFQRVLIDEHARMEEMKSCQQRYGHH